MLVKGATAVFLQLNDIWKYHMQAYVFYMQWNMSILEPISLHKSYIFEFQ